MSRRTFNHPERSHDLDSNPFPTAPEKGPAIGEPNAAVLRHATAVNLMKSIFILNEVTNECDVVGYLYRKE